MKRLFLLGLGLCFTLSLIFVLGTVFSSSPDAFAVDMGGTMDGGGNDGNNMPPPEDSPATTDTLTAGGGSDNDDDDDDNDDDSGGSRDDDDDDDNDKVNEPTSEDAPATTDTLTAKKVECPPGQEVTLFSTTCEPAGAPSAATVCPTAPTPLPTNCPPGTHQPPSGILPFRGDEPRLIDFYAMPVPDPDSVIRIDKTGAGSIFTFADGTIRTSARIPGPTDKTIITPGPRTPLDRLQVDQVEQISYINKGGEVPPITDISIKYKDGGKIEYSDDLQFIRFDDGKGNTQIIEVQRYTGDTIVTKPDRSVTIYPKAGTGNTYTVYPRAADGTQKTVTMTSEGQAILTIRDADNNIIPPNE